MNEIKIYYYTAWNGYSWQGCDEATSSSLQRYMEAAGVLPGEEGKTPFGGAIACQVGDDMGVAVYRCGVREKGDAFGRDSLFIALAFVPLKCGPVDFAAVMAMSQMSPSGRGELSPVSVPMDGLSLPRRAGWDRTWRVESFNTRFSGISGLQEVSSLFFAKTCQLGLMQAVFASDTGSLAGVSVSLSYRVFPEVAALDEAAKAYADSEKLSRGSLSESHPASVRLFDAAAQLQARRIDKMPDYAGLVEFFAERDKALGGVISRASARSRSAYGQSPKNGHSDPTPAQHSHVDGQGGRSVFPHMLVVVIVLLTTALAALQVVSLRKRSKLQNEVEELKNKIEATNNEHTVGEDKWQEITTKLKQELAEQKRKVESLQSQLDREISDRAATKKQLEELSASNSTLRAECQANEMRLHEAGKVEEANAKASKLVRERLEDHEAFVSSLAKLAKPGASQKANLESLSNQRRKAPRDMSVEKAAELVGKFKVLEDYYVSEVGKELEDLRTEVRKFSAATSGHAPARNNAMSVTKGVAASIPAPAPKPTYDILKDDARGHKSDYFGRTADDCSCSRCKEAIESKSKSDRLFADAKLIKDALSYYDKKVRDDGEKQLAKDFASIEYTRAMDALKSASSGNAERDAKKLKEAADLFETAVSNAQKKAKERVLQAEKDCEDAERRVDAGVAEKFAGKRFKDAKDKSRDLRAKYDKKSIDPKRYTTQLGVLEAEFKAIKRELEEKSRPQPNPKDERKVADKQQKGGS